MPPEDSGKKLSPEQIDLLRRWIAEGAQWQGHWSLITPKRPEIPKVKQNDWASNPIDDFILARLQAEGLNPSEEADRRSLIRRVTFDLTGLPPELKEVEDFVNDKSADAYEQVVDRLLSSPRYGEHMARFWLDAARYGDTHGLHLDNYREMWPYRDWVVQAFNQNMPFDQFTTEQLAGDLLPNATLSQRVASGFNRCNVTTSEGGSIQEEVYVRNVTDRVETTGSVFMGMTFGCAVCHDHKYDPITSKDFYQLFAFFNSLDGNALDGNKKDHPPVERVPLPGQKERLDQVVGQLAALVSQMKARDEAASAEFDAWLTKAEAGASESSIPTEGLIAHYPLDETDGTETTNSVSPEAKGAFKGLPIRVDGKSGKALKFDPNSYVELGDVGRFERTDSFSYGAWVKTPGTTTGAAIARMDDGGGHRGYDLYLVNKKVAMHLIHQWSGDALKVTTKQDVLKPNVWHHLFVTYDGSSKSKGVMIYVDGKPQPFDVNNDTLKGTTITETPLLLGRRNPGSPFKAGEVDEVRLYNRLLTSSEVATLAGTDPIAPILKIARQKRSAEQQKTLRTHYLENVDSAYEQLKAQHAKLAAEKTKIEGQSATTLVFKELKEPRQAYLLVRGQYDKRGDKVERVTPSAFPPMAEGLPRDRLGLAKWLTSPQHPLMSRVTVNRFWQQCFGTGIVKTSEDFGSQGEFPSHPALLDYLAVNFRESGWNVKGLMKQIVMSSTYRQDSRVTKAALEKDPENRLLARGPRFRLDAEMLRDQALTFSGLLVNKLGGPSVKPPQPDGLWKAVGYSGSNTVKFTADTGEKIYRRSMYTFWKRTAPPPTMNAFDAPSRESCSMRRERTNTPLQALLMMNEQQYFESGRHLAERAMKEGGANPEQWIGYMFTRATCRQPDVQEAASLLDLYRENLAEYKSDSEAAKKLIAVGNTAPSAALDPVELAALAMVSNLILNLDEVVTKN